MKQRSKIIFSIACISVLFLFVSCSTEEVTTNPVNTPTITTTPVPSSTTTPGDTPLYEEINKLNAEKDELAQENDSLKARVQNLEDSLKSANNSPLSSNYIINELLEKIYREKSKVDIFPGKLQSIRMETIGETIYFIFTIDRMAVNPDWDGPGTAGGKGYFINSKEEYKEYKGNINTVFENKGYETYSEKQKDILANYGNNRVYNFYMIGDEIVYVGRDPGP